MFADDTCLLVSHSSLDSLIREANEEWSNISEWFILNTLFLNVQKTNFMIFSNKRYGQEEVEILIDGIKIIQEIDMETFFWICVQKIVSKLTLYTTVV